MYRVQWRAILSAIFNQYQLVTLLGYLNQESYDGPDMQYVQNCRILEKQKVRSASEEILRLL
jgi:hypothetical protein